MVPFYIIDWEGSFLAPKDLWRRRSSIEALVGDGCVPFT
jgi:hypothetical protein